jgi:hypothetical protein
MNNDTYQALVAYKAAASNYYQLADKAEKERWRLYDLWCHVIREFSGDGGMAVDALNELDKEQMKCKTKQSSDDTSECESIG